MKHIRNQGFTLLEVLIAISIFALIGVGSFLLLSNLLHTKDTLDTHSSEMADIEVFLSLLNRDLSQAVALQIGNGKLDAAALLYPGEEGALLITKAPTPQVAAAMATVTSNVLYAHKTASNQQTGSGLTRHVLYNTKTGQDATPQWKRTLAASELPSADQQFGNSIQGLKFRLMDADKGWLEQWPVKQPATPPTTNISGEPKEIIRFPLPTAVEVTITSNLFGEITRYVALPRGIPVITFDTQEAKRGPGA
ncbi:MAG TPA: type II secretion system protein GspJ [Candidatus Acidoferrum sp.]|nr:type II secretion system protein GspJ [Candidatus Acidoferrum sp.]